MKTKVLKYKDSQGKEHVLSPIVISGQGLPEEGESGQVLTKTEDGAEWADIKDPDLTNYATKEEVAQAKSEVKDELIGTAPGTYDTLGEIADYIKEHGEVAAGMAADIAAKADKSELANYQEKLPEDGKPGQVLTQTEEGIKWLTPNDCDCEELTEEELLEVLGIEESEDDFDILIDGEKVSKGQELSANAVGRYLNLSLQTKEGVPDLIQYNITEVFIPFQDKGWIHGGKTYISVDNRKTLEGDERTSTVEVVVNDKFRIPLVINQQENKALSTESMTKTVTLGWEVSWDHDGPIMYGEFPDGTVSLRATYTSGSTGTVDYPLGLAEDQYPEGSHLEYDEGYDYGSIGEDGIYIPMNNEPQYRIWELGVTLVTKDGKTGRTVFRIRQGENFMIDEP